MARSFPLAGFGVVGRSGAVVGLLRDPCPCPDLGRFFVWGSTTQRLPLGGKLSPEVTDEGAILYPTFPCRKIGLSPQRLSSPVPLGESIAPSSAPVYALGHLPPKGKALGVGASLSDYNTHPSQPAQLGGGPLRALGYGPQARQKKKEAPRRVPPTRKGGSREEEPLPPWCSFLRLSSKEYKIPYAPTSPPTLTEF